MTNKLFSDTSQYVPVWDATDITAEVVFLEPIYPARGKKAPDNED